MADEYPHDYDTAMLEMLDIIWGDGFMSPGGPQAVRETLDGIALAGRHVLDIGCGIGGVDQVLVSLGAARVMAIDIAASLVALARKRFTDPRITFQTIEPEQPLPFPDASFDLVFTKDAWLHVLDKRGLLREVHRVLKPGGQLAGGDWTKGPEPFSADMLYFIELEGIPYHPITLADYGLMLHEIGFEDVRLQDLNAWYRELGRQEHERMKGELYDLMTEKLGAEVRDHFLEDWRMLTVVLDKGELRPGRMWGRKPA